MLSVTNYYSQQWIEMERMNVALVVQSVVEWLKENFSVANTDFVDINYLIQWQPREILLLYVLVLETLPVTQSEALKETILIGHLKESYFSAITALQGLFTEQRCPYKIGANRKKTYVSAPLVQLMKAYALEEDTFRVWKLYPVSMAGQLVMAVRPSTIDIIRSRRGEITLDMTQSMVDVGRLVSMVEHKYAALFSPAMKGVWLDAAQEVKKDAMAIGLKTGNPNLWAISIWYLENSQRFHKMMQKLEPGSGTSTKLKAPKQGLPMFAERPRLNEREIAQLVDEWKHSFFAAYATYQRGSLLAENFYEKVGKAMNTALQIPPPRITDMAAKIEVYAYVLWTMPDEIRYVRASYMPQYLKEWEDNTGQEKIDKGVKLIE